MSENNEIRLINACVRKNKQIKQLQVEKIELINILQTLQKLLSFEFGRSLDNDSYYIFTNHFATIKESEYILLNDFLERYGIK